MHAQCVAMVVVLAAHLIAIPGASAQPAPTRPTAIGDIWSSREEPIYVPREALEMPNVIAPGDTEMATGDVWPSLKGQSHVRGEFGADD